jgi:hypothetical protein
VSAVFTTLTPVGAYLRPPSPAVGERVHLAIFEKPVVTQFEIQESAAIAGGALTGNTFVAPSHISMAG